MKYECSPHPGFMKALYLVAASTFVFASCQQIRYADDVGFLNSAQAGSMEFMVKVNNKVCKDIDGKVGLCAARTKSDLGVSFTQEPRPYSYEFILKCSSAIDSDFSQTVAKGQPLKFTIEPSKFASVLSFTCVGEVLPLDDRQAQEISGSWEVHVIVYDDDYEPREIIYYQEQKGKRYLTAGRYALHTTICSEGECKTFKKKPMVEVAGPDVKAYSESYMMRFNYYGL